jgi:hypothetical protein
MNFASLNLASSDKTKSLAVGPRSSPLDLSHFSQTRPPPLLTSPAYPPRPPPLPRLRHFVPSSHLPPFLPHSPHPHQVDRHRPRLADGRRARCRPGAMASRPACSLVRCGAPSNSPGRITLTAEAVQSAVFTPARGTVPATRTRRRPRREPWRSFLRGMPRAWSLPAASLPM